MFFDLHNATEKGVFIKSPLSQLSTQISLLKKLVAIPSATPNIQGVQLIQTMIETELCKMGFETQRIPHKEKEYADLLIGELTPSGYKKTVTVVCHSDTVFDSRDARLKIKSIGPLMIGPGVADNKGGVIVALGGISRFIDANKDFLRIRFVCSPNEEIGSHGFTETFRTLGEDSDLILGFEPSTEAGDIINCRSGNRWYFIESKGIEAHAGRASGEEINAAHEIMIKIQKILDLRAKYSDLKVNVAQLSGGKDRYNIVCGNASVKIDIRYSKFSTRDEVHSAIQEIVQTPFLSSNTGKPSKSSFRLDDDCPPLQKSENQAHFADRYKETIEQIEKKSISLQMVGGASDVNYFSNNKNFSLCGLGPIAGKIHTGEEHIELLSLETRAEALCQFLLSLGTS